MHEVCKVERCVHEILSTDPRYDKKRIEDQKGGLLEDWYRWVLDRWVLDNVQFQQWHNDPQKQLLWIKGGPGQGKTMLLCGIVDELQKSKAKTCLVSYFFCQATDSRINTATAVVRGLLFLLVSQQPSLVSYVRNKCDHAGKTMFEDANAWVALTEIFTDVLLDPRLNATYLIIDALDECVTDLPKLLDFVAKHSSMSSRVKWIVSSRNQLDIEEQLERAGLKVRLSLDLSAESVSTTVRTFIEQKVSQLAQQKKYDERTRDAVLEYLASNANDSLLWVALVCQNLEMTAKRDVLKKLNSFPPGLYAIYRRMMDQIRISEDAELCERILAFVSAQHRPVTLDELASFVDMPDGVSGNYEDLLDIIRLCGSFLIVQERTVSCIHISAKHFLLNQASYEISPFRTDGDHDAILSELAEEESSQAMTYTPSGNRMKGSERDSGYGSASRPGTLTALSESAFQDDNLELQPAGKLDKAENDNDEEIHSLPSDDDDIQSQTSDGTTIAEWNGKRLIRGFLAEEPQFRELCEKAMSRLESQRFVENLRRLLKSFHQNLTAEAETEAEKAIARLLRSRRGRLRISQELALQIQQVQDEVRHGSKLDLQIAPEYKIGIETWLSSVPGRPKDPPGDTWARECESSTSGSDDGSVEDKFPYISELKKSLRGTRSFQTLLKDCMLMFLPIELRHVLLSIPKQDVWVSREQDLSVANMVKAWVEDKTKVRWNWWPLRQRKRMLQDSESRMFWQCTCGAEQWQIISTEQHELVTKILALSGDKPQSPYWCRTKGKGMQVTTWFAGMFRKASPAPTATSASSAAQRYTPPRNAAPASSIASGSSPNNSGQSGLPASIPTLRQGSLITNQQGHSATPNSTGQTKSYILIGVQGSRRTLIPSQIPTNDQSTDSSVFQDLKKCYNTHRGKLRLRFSIWRLEYCEVVKFNRLALDRMVREHSDLPSDNIYEYSPRYGDSGARNPPISPHLFQALFYACRSPCNWPIPHDCMPLLGGDKNLKRIPRRKRCFEQDLTSPIWGLETVFEVSFAYVFVYHCVMLAGPFAFFSWWLKAHPDDFQNASVPATIALGALSLFWSGAGILTSRSSA